MNNENQRCEQIGYSPIEEQQSERKLAMALQRISSWHVGRAMLQRIDAQKALSDTDLESSCLIETNLNLSAATVDAYLNLHG